MSRNKRQERMSRREKVGEVLPVVHGEVVVPRQQHATKLEPANPRQKQLLAFLREGRQVVFAQGSAGTGKSFIAAYYAAEQLRLKKIDKIYLVRANVSTGKSLGMLPGTLEEKLLPFFKQTLSHLATFMGQSFLTYCTEKNVVEMLSIEHMRGMSVERAMVIVEESQNLTSDELEMILSRIGDASQFVFTGDQKQNDLKGASGLISTIDLIARMLDSQPEYLDDSDVQCLDDNIGIVTFTPADVVRSGLCKAFVKMYYNN
jgi:phosphate starvation-inducible PhoH-like protein